MKVSITIEREDDDEDAGTTMGITAVGVDQMEVFSMVIAGAEMVIYEHVRQELLENGAEPLEAEYAAPLRTRLLAIEQLVGQNLTPYSWVALDLSES